MMGATHAVAGALAALLLTSPADPRAALAIAGVGAVAALVPDVDHPRSEIRQRMGCVGHLLLWWLPHRGITHTMVAFFLVAVVAGALPPDLRGAVVVGYGSHLLLDACTPTGVPLLWPFFKVMCRAPLPTVRTGGIRESLFGAACSAALLWIGYSILS